MSPLTTISSSLLGSIVLTLLIYTGSLLPVGEREVGPLENIHGIPYSVVDGTLHVDEPLAHTDLYLNQPAFAKNLELTVEYIPTNITSLAVGVRDNSFWLSYPKYVIYLTDQSPGHESTTRTIPLTDKLQEPDQSLDIMFFAEGEDPQWELVSLSLRVHHSWPSWLEFKDHARAILYRERAL